MLCPPCKSTIKRSYQNHHQGFQKPYSHVVASADNISMPHVHLILPKPVQRVLPPSEDEDVDVGVGDQDQVVVEEEEHDHPEGVPEWEFVQSTSIQPVCFMQEVGDVEIILLFPCHAPVVLFGYS